MGPRRTLANMCICKQNFSKDCGSKGVYEPVCYLSRKWGKKSVECKPGQIPKEKEFVEVQPAIQRIPACYRSRIKTSWDHSRGKKSPESPSSLGQHCKELNSGCGSLSHGGGRQWKQWIVWIVAGEIHFSSVLPGLLSGDLHDWVKESDKNTKAY